MTWLYDWIIFQAILSLLTFITQTPIVFALPLPGDKADKDNFMSSITRLRHHGNQHHVRHTKVTEGIKKDILKKLGYDKVPLVDKSNTTVHERRKALKMYRKSLEEMNSDIHNLYEQSEDSQVKLYQRIVDNGYRPEDVLPHNVSRPDNVHLYFPISIPLPEDPYKDIHVHSAKLKLNVIHTLPDIYTEINSLEEKAVHVSIYQTVPHVISGQKVALRRLLDSQMVSLEKTGWLEFDIREAVQEWAWDKEMNWGLEITCDHQSYNINDLVQFFLSDAEIEGTLLDDFLPHVTILSQEKEILGRARRSGEEDYDCERGQTKCCRVPIDIQFKDIGLDFIVEPSGFQAYYCSGSCPKGYKVAHNFAPIQSLLNMISPINVPPPCCTPSALKSLPVLLYDRHGNLVEEIINDIIITRCSCA